MFHPKGPTLFELARQGLSSTEAAYDLIASKFDYTPFRTPDFILEAVAAKVAEWAPVDSILDVCCGTGAAMETLRPLCRDRLVGIDMSRGMLDVARTRTAYAPGDARLEFVHANAFDMTFDAEFDLAVSLGALGHILPHEMPVLVDRIARALKPGGRFLFTARAFPSVWSLRLWTCAAFDVVAHARNLLIKPPFHMYYLALRFPRVKALLEKRGFKVRVYDAFDGPHGDLKLVIATLMKCNGYLRRTPGRNESADG